MQLQLVSKYGYNGELHKVVTHDGYILELHRITGRANSTAQGKPVAFVMPGLLASSAAWVLSGPEKGLGKRSILTSYTKNIELELSYEVLK